MAENKFLVISSRAGVFTMNGEKPLPESRQTMAVAQETLF